MPIYAVPIVKHSRFFSSNGEMSACDQWKGPSTKQGVSCERGPFKYNKKPWSALWTSKHSLIVVYFLKPNSPQQELL
jgi:hypothetical protein